MSFGKVANCLLAVLVTLANGMPQSDDGKATTQETPGGSLPFLQFTNGGIRVNFAGYHAEAGLGGGLQRGANGGLHASVGTPWGAHAGAGLGGQVDGKDGALGGGLYARAGLGRGRPEAGAGIGGALDGSGRSLSPIAGGMYAGATAGGPGTGVYLGGNVRPKDGGLVIEEAAGIPPDVVRKDVGAGDSVTTTPTTTTKSRTNIQIIRARPKDAQQQQQEQKVAAAVLPADEEEKRTRNNEVRRAVPVATKIAVVGAYAAPAAPPAVQTIVEKSVVVPAVAVTAVPVPVEQPVTEIVPVYPRWYFRKRFWTVPRKTVYVAPVAADTQVASSEAVADAFGGAGGTVVVSKTAYAGGSLFNDIFNIPISTLSAVNQLLNNFG